MSLIIRVYAMPQNIAVELSAVIVSVENATPLVQTGAGPALPTGPLEIAHNTLEQALRGWVC